MKKNSLQNICRQVRERVLTMTHAAKSSHIGTNYSMIELVVVLYLRILRIDPEQPEWSERDRFVLSKGHGCAALYVILAQKGFFPLDWLDSFYQDGSSLAGHATHSVPGVEVSTGSLGHGLSIATGMALVGKRDKKDWRVFTMLSDGECDEGSTWEAMLFAGHHHLDNLVAIVDYNKIQALGHTSQVLDLESFVSKWDAFGWSVQEIDGHDLQQIEEILKTVPFSPGKPSCVIANTIKGKGVSFMEDDLLWHYRFPHDDEYASALEELRGDW
jgi:transketolase